jgi:methanogenic corrinoid protein MtbC1
MSLSIEEIIREAKELPLVPLKATSAYQANIPALKEYVDEALSSNPSISELTGKNPLQMMYDNHRHHAAFMTTVFSVGNYELLARIIPWVYRAYSSHGFSFEYFPLELQTWKKALDQHLDQSLTGEIKTIYDWMISRHQDMIALSKIQSDEPLPVSEDWLERKNSFMASLLKGDHQKCLSMATDWIKTAEDLEGFYLQIIQPVMYEVGMLWERGEISVAQEHLASAIIVRVLTAASMMVKRPSKSAGKVMISTAPHEYHEIGSWVISDMLEHAGWDVRYLGANTPVEDLVTMAREFQPDVLALSVTMPFNILGARDVISAMREEPSLEHTRTIIGGQAFTQTTGLWQSTGADAFAVNARQALAQAEKWIHDETS